jgi:protein-S-isoprenylcysteine O-methyltransferase Ste14
MTEPKDHADVKIHPPILVVIHIVVAYVLGQLIPLPFAVSPLVENIGFAFVVMGFLLGVGALLEFRRAHTTLDPHGNVSEIVTGGIYRFSRNPIYLGFALMILGIPLNSGIYWGVVLVPVFILFCTQLVIRHEEAYLEKKFGDFYTSYKSRVRRWL